MTRRRLFGAALAAIMVIGGVAIARTLSGDQRIYLYADQVARESSRWQGEHLAVHGTVQAGSRQHGSDADDWRFNLVWRGVALRVRYTGVTPSTFADSAEAVVVGELRDGELRARDLLVLAPD